MARFLIFVEIMLTLQFSCTLLLLKECPISTTNVLVNVWIKIFLVAKSK